MSNRALLRRCKLAAAVLSLFGGPACCCAEETPSHFAEIHVVDDATGRGVPLVELTTVNHLRWVTDNAGRVAFYEPGLMGRPVYFFVRSHGYQFPADGFGNEGLSLSLKPGETLTVRLKRENIAERMYRVTGEGLYRDSVLLGRSTPLAEPLGAGRVAGQDSTFALPYRDKLFWFWGDTSRMSYPLGHFWMAGAVSESPSSGGLDPATGVDLNYFVDDHGFSRPMCRLSVEHGLIWADAFAAVRDDDAQERLVCHYVHLESLDKVLGHGLAIYDDRREEFVRTAELAPQDRWRWPAQAHPVHQEIDGVDYLLLGEVYPTVRVPARLDDFCDLDRYEAWTCLTSDSTEDQPSLDRNAQGRLQWNWRRDATPVDHALERKLIRQGLISPDEARGQPLDVDSGTPIRLHRGSVNWNQYRNRWIMIACEQEGTSNLGEVWYAEATHPTGPWRLAKKVLTHHQYSFYNPVHHGFFDQQGGRLIYFEGTYTTTFSGQTQATPRYDYNQIMYRLDLSNDRLRAAGPSSDTSGNSSND